MIYVLADITVADGRRDDFLKLFHALVPQVRAEVGCLEYGPAVDVETPIDAQVAPRADVVTVVEKWESVEALRRHLVAPHMTQFREAAAEIMRDVSLKIVEPA